MKNSPRKTFSRRRFLRGAGAAAAGLLAAGCCPRALIEAVESTVAVEPTGMPVPTIIPTHDPTATPTAVSSSPPTGAPTSAPIDVPASAPTDVPTDVPESVFRSRVAIGQATSYDRALIRQQVEALLDGIGGLGDVVRPGDRVAIKVNLTGGTDWDGAGGGPGTDTFVTHPEVVRALGELLWDAGAGEILIVEAVYQWHSYQLWGYEEVAADIGASLIDLNTPDPYADFATIPVGEGAFIYQDWIFNHILEEADVFVSVAKMKCHWTAGVTAAVKNLVGLVPAVSYRLDEEHSHRSALHGPTENEARTRLPRVILDLVRARPIDLALIDGVKTVEGGEGPWVGCFRPVQPGVLLAGKDVVATDAVAAAVMGFDPATDYPAAPFLRGDNHLNLAYDLGLGTNRLEEIRVVGAEIDEVVYSFNPCWG